MSDMLSKREAWLSRDGVRHIHVSWDEDKGDHIKTTKVEGPADDGTWLPSLAVLRTDIDAEVSADWVALEAAIKAAIDGAVAPVGQETEFGAFQLQSADIAAMVALSIKDGIDCAIWSKWNEHALGG